jgi:hypothetical protein
MSGPSHPVPQPAQDVRGPGHAMPARDARARGPRPERAAARGRAGTVAGEVTDELPAQPALYPSTARTDRRLQRRGKVTR